MKPVPYYGTTNIRLSKDKWYDASFIQGPTNIRLYNRHVKAVHDKELQILGSITVT